jgi:hypothetical protein
MHQSPFFLVGRAATDTRLGNNGEQENSATVGNQIPISHYQTSHT